VPNSPELIALFHRCDIFALPTKGDCTPVVLAEAASAGLPTVATDVGAVSESVIDGMTGRLVEATAASIAEGLRRMIVEPTYRLKLGEAAARHAAEQMDSERNARRLLDGLVASAHACQPASRVVLTVSGTVAPDTEDAIATGARPLADYTAIARSTGASLLDWSRLRAESSRSTRIVRRLGGDNLAVAHHLYRQRKALDVVLTDGEQVGLPLAAMLRLGGRGSLRHVMIAHRISARKKQLPIRLLGLDRCVDHVLVYASRQRQVARQLFRRPGQRVQLIDFMVDSKFFKAQRPLEMRTETRRPVLCAAGREFRDYPTLIEAVCDLDVDLVIASGSPWSKRSDNAHQVDLPPNVVVTSYTQRGLRDQLDRSDMLVLPLQANDFQAGITTILEAMSMERPVVCTATLGQTDVVVDGVNGLYVPPGDVEAMRQAIQRLIDDPDDAAAMGKRGRELVEVRGDVRRYAEIFARIVATQLER
jgi:glycosyltransferase involved in cell wall biosynthesis